MAVETRVLINGQWVTRSMDIRQILESNQEKDKDHCKIPRARSLPTFGIVSRTLLHSPVVNSIMPARLRHEDKNDVVFIGEDFVYIKEILADGHLQYIGTKADFGSRIRAAKVFGEPRNIEVSETGWPATPAAASAALTKRQQTVSIKVEEGDDVNMNDCSSTTIPPQILMLTLESNELVYLFARHDSNGELRFYDSSLPLPAGRSFLEQPGKFLAVDPKSRAVAVAACEGTLIVYGTKTMDRLGQDYAANPVEWTPFTQEQPFQGIDGAIIKMEFLYPARDDMDHVILLVIFCKNKKLRMTCWDWLHSEGVRSARIRINSQPLPRRELPNLIISLEHSSAFLLVVGNKAYLYNDVLSGTAQNTSLVIGCNEGPRYPGRSSRMPLWTSWARTTRHNGWRGDRNEAFYLLREDGAIVYLQVNGGSGVTSGSAGHFDCNADTAFACFEVWRQGLRLLSPDILVVAGDASNGQVVKIGAWPEETVPEGSTYKNHDRGRAMVMKPDFLEQFPNWTPTMDMMLFDSSIGESRSGRQRNKIITTANRAPFGSICELRRGIEAHLDAVLELGQLQGATDLWSLPDPDGDGFFHLISMPLGAIMVHVLKEDSQIYAWDVTDPGPCCVDFSSETVAFASISGALVVQVTRHAIHILDLASGEHKLHLTHAPHMPPGGTITAATIHPEAAVIVVAFRVDRRNELQLYRATGQSDSFNVTTIGEALPLQSDPTSLTLFDIRDWVCAFVSLADGSLHMFRAHPTEGFTWVFSHHTPIASTDSSPAVCESVVLLKSAVHSALPCDDYLLVCGLRNGQLYTVELKVNPEGSSTVPGIVCGRANMTIMGNTPVKLVTEQAGPASIAFLICGSDLCQLDYSRGRAAGLSISSIWITDRNEPSFEQPQVSVLSSVYPRDYPERSLAGTVVCIAGSRLLIAQLDEQHQAVPRRLVLNESPNSNGSPNRLIYCRHLGMMVTASVRVEVRDIPSRSPRHDMSTHRLNRAVIDFVRLHEPESDIEKWHYVRSFDLYPGEKVYSLLDWVLKHDDGTKYGFLVVGTGMQEENTQKGRVLLLHTKEDGQNQVHVRITKIMPFKSLVYAVATYGETDLVVSTGKQLQIFRFMPAGRRLLRICIHNIPSAGIHITTQPPFIYVSTSEDSFMVFELKDNDSSPDGQKSLYLLFSDDGARKTTHHLSLTLPLDTLSQPSSSSHSDAASPPTNQQRDPHIPNLVLVADKSGSVTGLLHPDPKAPHLQSAAPTIFEAALPRSITRLRRGDVRPPWHRRNLPGVLADDIIGSASEGSVFSFSIVDERAWRMLRFLQNLCRWEREELLERVGRGTGIRAVLEPDREVSGMKRKTGFHVDGDVLARFVRVGGRERLERLLRGLCEGEEREERSDVEVERMERFRELAESLLGISEAGMEEVADKVLDWLRGIVMPVL